MDREEKRKNRKPDNLKQGSSYRSGDRIDPVPGSSRRTGDSGKAAAKERSCLGSPQAIWYNSGLHDAGRIARK